MLPLGVQKCSFRGTMKKVQCCHSRYRNALLEVQTMRYKNVPILKVQFCTRRGYAGGDEAFVPFKVQNRPLISLCVPADTTSRTRKTLKAGFMLAL